MKTKINIAEILSVGDLPNETWKDIPGYNGYYQVSNLGRVKSLKRFFKTGRGRIAETKLRILRQADSRDGYKMVVLCVNGEQLTRRVHRLVAMAFIPNPHNYPVINHKNEIRTDNRCSNLEWCTVSYNDTYGHALEKRKEKLSIKVYQYDSSKKLIKIFPSISETARVVGCNIASIHYHIKHKCKKPYRGYYYRTTDEWKGGGL